MSFGQNKDPRFQKPLLKNHYASLGSLDTGLIRIVYQNRFSAFPND
jgi:hypothetical protein